MPSGIRVSGRGSRPYRKYRPLPALILITLLGGFSLFVWFKALHDDADIDAAVRCDPPAAPPAGVTYTSAGHGALNDVNPIPPDRVAFRVLNASQARGQAAIITEELRQLGFSQAGKPADDPAYENRSANCRGQIRYGDNGAPAARTLSLLDGCIELIKDNRKDASVDLAIGTQFGSVLPQREAMQILDELAAWSEERRGQGSGELAAGDSGPEIEPTLLQAARSTSC